MRHPVAVGPLLKQKPKRKSVSLEGGDRLILEVVQGPLKNTRGEGETEELRENRGKANKDVQWLEISSYLHNCASVI